MNLLTGVWGPGLVFLLLAFWLVRKVIKAARTESVLEENRLAAALGQEAEALRARAAAPSMNAPAGAGLTGREGQQVTASAQDGSESGPAVTQRPRLAALPGAPAETTRRPRLAAVPAVPAAPSFRKSLAAADVASCAPEHLAVLGALLDERERLGLPVHVAVLWARSAGAHLAWCERRTPMSASGAPVREALCAALVRDGQVVKRWSYGE